LAVRRVPPDDRQPSATAAALLSMRACDLRGSGLRVVLLPGSRQVGDARPVWGRLVVVSGPVPSSFLGVLIVGGAGGC
jgi:hypothetical protein